MKMLITGANGFLGKSLTDYFSLKYQVIALSKQSLDVTDSVRVKEALAMYSPDAILHCGEKCPKPGKLGEFTTKDFGDTLQGFYNLVNTKEKKTKLFVFGSGAAFGGKPICQVEETDSLSSMPIDMYGLVKNYISRLLYQQHGNLPLDNVYSLNLFGCFGKHENKQRFFPSILKESRGGKQVKVAFKFMDFFYVEDVARVIDYFLIRNPHGVPNQYNLVYPEVYSLRELAIIAIGNDTKVEQTGAATESYTATGDLLARELIPFKGLTAGIRECLKTWKSD